MNRHGQLHVLTYLTERGNHPFARLAKMQCSHCNAQYGANTCDIHLRKCPECQGTKQPGLPLPAEEAA